MPIFTHLKFNGSRRYIDTLSRRSKIQHVSFKHRHAQAVICYNLAPSQSLLLLSLQLINQIFRRIIDVRPPVFWYALQYHYVSIGVLRHCVCGTPIRFARQVHTDAEGVLTCKYNTPSSNTASEYVPF